MPAAAHNVVEYFAALFSTRTIALRPEAGLAEFSQPDFDGDLERFARESILWGRKSGTLLDEITATGGAPVGSPG